MAFGSKTKTPREYFNQARLYEYAVRALGRRMRTEVELRRLMAQRAEPGEVGAAAVAAVIAKLKEMHYLDDRSYAETYARLRQQNEKFGERRVRQDLRQKGVKAELVEEAVEARYGGASEEALAREHLERKRIPKPTNEKETARVMRRLVAAGFKTGTIYKILRQWDVPEESLAALDQMDPEAHEE